MPVRIVEADLSDRLHQEIVVRLTDAYARDAFGNGQPLTDEVRRAIVPGLHRRSQGGRSSPFMTWRFLPPTAGGGSDVHCCVQVRVALKSCSGRSREPGWAADQV